MSKDLKETNRIIKKWNSLMETITDEQRKWIIKNPTNELSEKMTMLDMYVSEHKNMVPDRECIMLLEHYTALLHEKF